MNRHGFLAFAGLTLLSSAPAPAIDLAHWNVSVYHGPNNSGPMTPLPSSSSAADVSVTAITVGPGLVSFAPCGGPLSLTACSGTGEMLAVHYSVAFDPDDYFEFTVSPAPGRQITYQTLRVPLGNQYRVLPVGSRSTGPKTWQLRYSLDGFATPGTVLGTISPFPFSLTSPPVPAGAGASEEVWPVFNIAALGTRAGTVTFRLYGYNIENADPSAPLGYGGGLMNRVVFVIQQRDVILTGTTSAATCYPDCDAGGTLNVNDYICFQTKFALGDPYADCDGNGVRNVNDYICFQTRFALGC